MSRGGKGNTRGRGGPANSLRRRLLAIEDKEVNEKKPELIQVPHSSNFITTELTSQGHYQSKQ